MVPVAVTLGTKVATDIGLGVLINGGAKWLTAPLELNALQKVCVGVAEFVLVSLVATKTDVVIDDTFQTFEEFMKTRKDRENWTSGGRTDSHGK